MFPCTRCGACCRRVIYVVHALGLTHWAPGVTDDGACRWLADDNTCTHYDDRPALCRVDDMRPDEIPAERWHEANAQHCNDWQEEDGMPEGYRVRLHVLPA